ncbi:MAG: hypothetical protein CVV41_11845 [Candidatus Riflebacteria bacterium HGW-Riflebacteria-1]|jgi:hypothetical protein|nr:MAG: hypothetical protein CVV41_11845 [Candidatus Riflebacteria bacterium HGW-Riflebacteria-1]
MNPFFREKRTFCLSVVVLFLVFTGLLPVFSDDYGRPVVSGSLQELENDELNKPTQKPNQPTHQPDQLGKPGDKPDPLGKPGKKPDQLGKPGEKPDQLGKPGKKPDQLGKPGDKPDQLGKPGNKPDQLGKPGDKPDQLGKPGKKPDQLGKPGDKPDQLGKPGKKPDQLGKPGDKLDPLGKPGKKPDQLGKPGDKADPLGKPGKKPDQLGKPGDKLDPLGKPGDKPDQLGKPGDKPDQLGKPGDKPDQLGKPGNKPKSPTENLKAGDIALQIKNDTAFALMVRASVVDSSERVNLTKAKSVNLAAQSQESVTLSPVNAGKISLTPSSAKTDISRDSKILLTVNKGKETRRLVLGYAKSAGMIVLSKDLFPQTHDPSNRSKMPTQSEESEKLQQKPTSSVKAQTVYVINQTGSSVNYNALLKPSNFDPIQGELKPGTNVLKFSAKKASSSLSKEKLNLILQMNYNIPGSPTVTFKKEAFDLDSQPTITLTRTIMGEPIGQGQASKKLK